MVDVDALLRENAEQRTLIGQLTEQLAKLNDRVAELLAVAQRRQRKPAVQKPPAPAPMIEGDAKHAFETRPKAPPKPAESARPKSRSKPTGRKPIPEHLEAEKHALRSASCAHCGSSALEHRSV